MISKLIHILFLVLWFLTSIPLSSYAQEIPFGDYSSRYSITSTVISSELAFGTIMQNQGADEVAIDEGAVIEFEGIKYLDVVVDITVTQPLQTSGCAQTSCTLPFTLKASYSNFGEDTDVAALNKTVYIGETSVDYSTPTGILRSQFRFLKSTGGPPAPPPTPDYEGYNLEAQKEKVFLFLYGSVNPDNNDTGSYTANITVSLYYD